MTQTITDPHIWAYRKVGDAWSIAVLKFNIGNDERVVNLDQPDVWAGRIACTHCPNRIALCVVHLGGQEPPQFLICPHCRQQKAVPQPFWAPAYHIRCRCGRSFTKIGVKDPKTQIPTMCSCCGGLSLSVERWPYAC